MVNRLFGMEMAGHIVGRFEYDEVSSVQKKGEITDLLFGIRYMDT